MSQLHPSNCFTRIHRHMEITLSAAIPQRKTIMNEVTGEVREIRTDEVTFIEDLYPRFEKILVNVKRYADNIDNLPPIIVSRRDNILIDGWHRWAAHRYVGKLTIKAIVHDATTDFEIKRLAMASQKDADNEYPFSEVTNGTS